ncbi:MAG: hypothetical protein J0H19_12510 [Rhodospirillales bacterium]|nr:hypothetical protein [Rhodospirillales bacterium]MBN8907273.1 hypothetical protein [Rhodospirillales bacterium]MBN8927433.1 hypothetical protein [Rhodospirillales bacterium]
MKAFRQSVLCAIARKNIRLIPATKSSLHAEFSNADQLGRALASLWQNAYISRRWNETHDEMEYCVKRTDGIPPSAQPEGFSTKIHDRWLSQV